MSWFTWGADKEAESVHHGDIPIAAPVPVPDPRILEKATKEALEKTKFLEFQQQDEQALEDSKNWTPNLSIGHFQSGIWLSGEGFDIPLRYIEKISIFYLGGAPVLSPNVYRSYYPLDRFLSLDFYAVEAAPGIIKATSITGQVHIIKVNRHNLNAMFDEILKQWRKYR